MAAAEPPSHTTLRGAGVVGSGGNGHTSSNNSGIICTPEQLYYHVVGHWPNEGQPTSGGSGDFTSGFPPPSTGDGGDEDESGRKKRRRTGKKTKTSEIWFQEAELAFCTAVSSIPPNGRTKIKFYGRPLGRNELIAAICTLATRRLYNRKQISSHSQVLKDKVPHPYKEIFTFEDKSRGGDEPGESATANVIENYQFPDAIYKIIKEPLGTDLANAQKPAWLVAKEAGEHPPPPASSETSGSRPQYWNNNNDYSSSYYGRSGPPPPQGLPGPSSYGRTRDRDGRSIPSVLDTSSYYSYQQTVRHQDTMSSYASTNLPPPHALPLLQIDPQSPVTAQGPNTGDSAVSRRYGYTSAPLSSTTPHSSRLPNGLWDDNRSPTTTSSQFDGQSPPGVSPRQATGPGAYDQRSLLPDSDGVILPQLQDPSSPHNDWKWPLSRGGVPALAPLQSLTGAATGQSGYGMSSSNWAGSPSTLGYLQPSWNGDSREPSRPRTFIPESMDLSLQTSTGHVPLSSSQVVASGGTVNFSDILRCSARYGFLYQYPPPNVPIFHIDVPLLIPNERHALLQPVPELVLSVAFRSTAPEHSNMVVTTDSAYANPDGAPTSFGRTTSQLRPQGSRGDSFVATAYLLDVAALYKNFVQNENTRSEGGTGLYDTLTSVAIPFTAVVQRVIRDYSGRTNNTRYGPIGTDLNEAACVFLYSFYVPTDPNARPVCQQVVFDVNTSPRVLDAADSFVANLMAGEEADPSRFNWMSQ